MKHLLEIRDLTDGQIMQLLDRAEYLKKNNHRIPTSIANKFVANLFFEPSTRTRFSFEVAEKRLGAHVLNFNEASSSSVKGETVYDTLKTLEAMGVEGAVIRTSENHLLKKIAPGMGLSLINAGAGTREHPTQCLLDLFTIRERFGQIRDVTIGIIGDITHSRVVGSHMYALPLLGAKLMVAGAPGMLERPDDPLPPKVEINSIDEIIAEADVVMMLRIQHERHLERFSMSVEEYHQMYGLTKERAQKMKANGIIMHPAPFNRCVEIDGDLVETEQSVIFQQVTNGVYTRMAVLEEVMVGGAKHA